MANNVKIEVVYANQHAPAGIQLSVPAGTTITQAIQLSGILKLHPELECPDNNVECPDNNLECPDNNLECPDNNVECPVKNVVGIFGEIKTLDTIVEDGDRIEIYQPIRVDPMRTRLMAAKSERKALLEQRALKKLQKKKPEK